VNDISVHSDPNVASYGASIQLQVKTIDRVLSSISHDLKNPLSIVRGNAQLAMMVNKDEKVRTCLGRIIDAVDGMTLILDEVRGLRKAPTDSKCVTALTTCSSVFWTR
jgi:signal transduction histidine kinase